eukprot:GFYU01066854.1.p1 GENE.GFYU01066854.1~~GFYU01066854.1.p1  ORF type:complete len:173 (-),score=41.13 GFYU01066854.1:53-535(-)
MNVQMFQYVAQGDESRNGKHLVPRADFHLGTHVNCMRRLKLTQVKGGLVKHFTYYGTLDGGLGHLTTVSDRTFRRLLALQTRLYTSISHVAGLHPKTFRLFRGKSRSHEMHRKNVLDGDLLSRFVSLDITTQRELAKSVGSTVEQILDNLLEVEMSTCVF